SHFPIAGQPERALVRDSGAVDRSRAWDSAIPERCTSPARGIPHFPSGGSLQRVSFCIFRVMDRSHAWNSAFSERWTTPAREFLLFLDNRLLARGKAHFLSDKLIPSRICIFLRDKLF